MEDHNRRLEEIANDVKTLRENHFAHLQKDVASLSEKFAGISADVDWLKRMTWVVLTASVGGLIGIVYQIAARR